MATTKGLKKVQKYQVSLVREKTIMREIDKKIDSSFKAGTVIQSLLSTDEWVQEKFGMICLDTGNKIIGIHVIFEGGMTETTVDLKMVMQRALLNNANSIIVFHNHPGNTPSFSMSDINLTRKIKEACKLLQIGFTDHVLIYDKDKYTSWAESGL